MGELEVGRECRRDVGGHFVSGRGRGPRRDGRHESEMSTGDDDDEEVYKMEESRPL